MSGPTTKKERSDGERKEQVTEARTDADEGQASLLMAIIEPWPYVPAFGPSMWPELQRTPTRIDPATGDRVRGALRVAAYPRFGRDDDIIVWLRDRGDGRLISEMG